MLKWAQLFLPCHRFSLFPQEANRVINTASTVIHAFGGLGLFLLGMVGMTDGLRALAGQAIGAALMRFTQTPWCGTVTGALVTAILQFSNAMDG